MRRVSVPDRSYFASMEDACKETKLADLFEGSEALDLRQLAGPFDNVEGLVERTTSPSAKKVNT